MKKPALLMASAFLTAAVLSAPAYAGDAAAGAGAFKKKCKVCHTISDGGKNGMGPNLFGVIGRKAGTLESFTKYSDGMKASGVVWDEATVGKLLEDPMGFVEGSKMKGGKIGDPAGRADIAAYLATLK